VKFSLKSRFAQLSLFILLFVFIANLAGRISSLNEAAVSCVGWPVCSPQGINGWLEILHRAAILVSSVLVIYHWQKAWKRYRDHVVVLPLSTLVLVFFFSNVFIGAIRSESNPASYMAGLHSLTAVLMWISLVTTTLASGFYSNIATVEFPPINIRQRIRDLFALTKPVVVSLLLVTTFGGMVAGMKAFPPFWLTVWTLLGGALAAGGASALNQYIDRDLDKNMQRTANRPLAAGRMFPAEGLAFGLALSIMSFYLLAGLVNLISAFLSLAGIVYYVWLYSILLKKRTVQNIVIGGGAGAIPPLVGWAAATGNISAAAMFMFAIIFFWTPPHFWALSIVRKKDYERAGVPMLPVIQGEKETRRQIWLYTLLLVALTLLMPLLNLAGTIFLISALILGLWLVSVARSVYKGAGNKIAWKMYRYSSMYLMFIFMALVVDAVVTVSH
jgi:protoheme IX farnesyltransferase